MIRKENMKSVEKLTLINQKVEILNKAVFAKKECELSYVNKGPNQYCLIIKNKEKEIHCGVYNVYDGVLSALGMLETIFGAAIREVTNGGTQE